MPTLFSKETVRDAVQAQTKSQLHELDKHELLRGGDEVTQIATFDQVRMIGSWFFKQNYNTVLPSNKPLPLGLLSRHKMNGGAAFLGKLALGAGPESHFPVTVEVIETATGSDLRLHIVPIHFRALEVAQHGQHTDSLLALAAAAAIAPQFILGLEGGLTGDCSTQKVEKSMIGVDHGTPLAVIFESFQLQSLVLDSATQITGNSSLTLKQAGHLHHLPEHNSAKISNAAGFSKVAAGVPLRTLLRSQLPQHALFIPTTIDQTGQPAISTLRESILATDPTCDFGSIAVALGMTASVVGDDKREQKMQRVLSLKSGDIPLREIIR